MEVKLEDTLNRAWKDDKTGFGYRMLQKMGWKEEKGLGKHETGMAAAIKIKKREDGLGLGVEKDHAGNNGWGSTVSSFSAVLDLLNSTYGSTSKKKSKKNKKTPTIQVRIKYGKMAAAKDITNKSSKDLEAVLGHHIPILDDSHDLESKPKKSKKKSKKVKREDDSTEEHDSKLEDPKPSRKKKRIADDESADCKDKEVVDCRSTGWKKK